MPRGQLLSPLATYTFGSFELPETLTEILSGTELRENEKSGIRGPYGTRIDQK